MSASMSGLPESLKYAKTHEWVKLEDQIIRVGITNFAQEELGDLVYIELPKLGQHYQVAEQCAVVESVKTASDLFSPMTGEVVEVNEDVLDSPEIVNDDPYDVWLFCIKFDDITEFNHLMDAQNYLKMIYD